MSKIYPISSRICSGDRSRSILCTSSNHGSNHRSSRSSILCTTSGNHRSILCTRILCTCSSRTCTSPMTRSRRTCTCSMPQSLISILGALSSNHMSGRHRHPAECQEQNRHRLKMSKHFDVRHARAQARQLSTLCVGSLFTSILSHVQSHSPHPSQSQPHASVQHESHSSQIPASHGKQMQ